MKIILVEMTLGKYIEMSKNVIKQRKQMSAYLEDLISFLSAYINIMFYECVYKPNIIRV